MEPRKHAHIGRIIGFTTGSDQFVDRIEKVLEVIGPCLIGDVPECTSGEFVVERHRNRPNLAGMWVGISEFHVAPGLTDLPEIPLSQGFDYVFP